LHVRSCVEPVHTEATVSQVPCFGLVPEGTREALLGLPVAIVWDLQRA
jgi:hypothetical protein